MLLLRTFTAALLATLAAAPLSATVLVLRFQNNSKFSDLNWIGESVAETLRADFAQANEIVIDRNAATEGMKQLGLRPEANFTKASIIRLGQTLEADRVVYGSYDAKLPPGVARMKDGDITLTAQFIDLRKLQSGPEMSEAGKIADLARYTEHLAWQSLNYFEARVHPSFEQFIAGRKLTRLDAEESYIHGLLAADKEQQQKWFLQASNLDPQFISPAYELGKIYLERKDPRQALKWLQRVPASDARYLEARFRLGIADYQAGDFNAAIACFKEVAKAMPLHEVYNNLAAAEDQLNLPSSIEDYRRAVEGDPADTLYLFNLGAALLRRNLFSEAQQKLQAVIDHSPDDSEADALLAQAQEHQVSPPAAKPLAPARLKTSLDSTAFRQLKAMLQPKSK